MISFVVATAVSAETKKDAEAKLLNSPPVTYPVEARAQGVEGFAVLELSVNEKGEITASRISQSTTSKILDEAALEWAKGLKLAPALRNGAAVASTKFVKVNFELKGIDTEIADINREPDPAKRAQKFEDYAFSKLRNNVAFALCGQSGYLKCYGVEYPQCLAQVNLTKDACFDQAKQQYPHADANGSMENFMGVYFACISTGFTDARKLDGAVVTQCMSAEKGNDSKFFSDLQR